MAMSPEGHGKASVHPNNKLPPITTMNVFFLTSRSLFYHCPADTISTAKMTLVRIQPKSGFCGEAICTEGHEKEKETVTEG